MKKPDLKSLDLAALWRGLTRPDPAGHDRVVPPTGFTAQLTVFTAGAMAFLAVFALALALATGRLAERWSSELAQTVTVRVSAPEGELDEQTRTVMEAWLMESGCSTSDSTPPSDSANANSSSFWMNLNAALAPPLISKDSMPPNPDICWICAR